MSQYTRDKIITALSKLHGIGHYKDIKPLEIFAETQGEKQLDKLLADKALLSSYISGSEFSVQYYVLAFIFDLAKIVHAKSHFDPFARLTSPIVHGNFENSTAIFLYSNEAESVKGIFANQRLKVIVGDPLSELDKIKDKYDFVSSFPPFGMRKEPITICGQTTSSDFSSMLLLKSSALLSKNGVSVFLMAPSFFINKTNKEIINKLSLFIDAVFALPSGAFLPYSSISGNLVLISKKPKDKTFVAEISADEETNKTILKNFAVRREGKAVQLGVLTDISGFITIQDLILRKEIEEYGYPLIRLADISTINTLKTDNPDEVSHKLNSVYLPKLGTSHVVTHPATMQIKPKNYYQIQLDSDKANSTYVANYFNSYMGKKIRKTLEIGAIRQIPLWRLSDCFIHLPDLATQSELIQIDSRLSEFSLRLEELKRKLWHYPRSLRNIQKELKSITQQKSIENWIDFLPFPISSILWRYYATKENNKKIEHLFHFFEALSEFLAMIMLSAFVQDMEFYKQECNRWLDKDIKFKDWYLNANFGSWNILTSRLSKAIRTFHSNKEKSELCESLLGNPPEGFFTMITNKGIVNVLLDTAELRNKWKGHGGISSEEDDRRKFVTLEERLNEIRKFLADGFEDTRILSPSTNEYEAGVYTYKAKELVGARTPFHEIIIKSLIPLDRKKLYLSHSGQNRPIELLPFIKFNETSEACYFYTSIESKNVRWISYHFDKDPEIIQPADDEILRAFEILRLS